MRIVKRCAVVLALVGLTIAAAGVLADEPAPTLYDRLGGLAPISVVVSDFIDVVVPDPMLNENPAIAEARDRVPAAYLKYHVTAMVCHATGGPCTYQGRDMHSSHAHLNITEAEWDRMEALFKQVLAKHGVPEAEQAELLAIVETTKADIVTAGAGAHGE